eukprot:10023142-Alexandrium_andersonii.AAC.1
MHSTSGRAHTGCFGNVAFPQAYRSQGDLTAVAPKNVQQFVSSRGKRGKSAASGERRPEREHQRRSSDLLSLFCGYLITRRFKHPERHKCSTMPNHDVIPQAYRSKCVLTAAAQRRMFSNEFHHWESCEKRMT